MALNRNLRLLFRSYTMAIAKKYYYIKACKLVLFLSCEAWVSL